MSTRPVISPVVFGSAPLNDTTPFTYRDSLTYQEKLQTLQKYLNETIVSGIDAVEDWVEWLFQFINNKSGNLPIEYVDLVENYTIEIDPTWPDSHIHYIMFRQNVVGGWDVTPGANIAGSLAVEQMPEQYTLAWLVPRGDGTWELESWDTSVAKVVNTGVQTRAAITALIGEYDQENIQPQLDALETTLIAAMTDLESQVNSQIDTLTSYVNTQVADLTNYVNGEIGDINEVLNNRLSESNVSTFYIEARKHGAIGDGIADDTLAIQSVFDYAKRVEVFAGRNSVTVVFAPNAVYRVTQELVISRRTRVHGNSAELLRDHSGYLLMNGVRGESYSGYSGHGDISVYDLTLNHNGISQPGQGSTVAFAHAENIVFDGVVFLDATSHAYELNSQKNVIVRDCKFYGYNNISANDFVEAIQLDNAVSSGFNAFGAHDATPSENVLIENCVFGRSDLLDAHPRSIGSHGSRVDKPHANVRIKGCTFREHSSIAIRPYNWNDVIVSDCHSYGAGDFIQINTPIVGAGNSDNTKTSAGVQTGASIPNSGFDITACSSVSGGGVWLSGEASGRIYNTRIIGCDFADTVGSGTARGVTGAYIDGLLVSGCNLTGFEVGIGFLANSIEYRARIIGCEIRYCFDHGIYMSQFRQLTVSGNSTYNCGYESPVGSHIRVSGATAMFTVDHNVGYTNGAYESLYGVYVASDVIRGVIDGNVYAGVGSTATIDVPDVPTLIESNNVN